MLDETRSLDENEELVFQSITGYSGESGVFYKSSDERVSPERFGKEYNDVEDEYEALERLHTIAPDFWAKPLLKTYDEDGNVDGYFMEEVQGFELNEFTNTYSSKVSQNRENADLDVDLITRQIQYLDNILNLYGEAHGDLKPWNIKVNPETSKITAYDPVGFDSQTASTAKARQEDKEQIDKILADLENAS